MKLFYSFTLFFLCTVNIANAEPASKESIQKFFEITKAKALTESIYKQTLPMLKNSLLESVPESANKSEAIKKIDELLPKVEELLKQELSWASLESSYIQIYAETFSQEELNGIISFYESPSGSAFLNKTPIIMQKSMAIISAKMPEIIKKVNALAEEKKN